MQTMRVSGSSRVPPLSGAIAKALRADSTLALTAIGANAVSQAVKAVAAARAYLAEDSLDAACYPSFIEAEIDGEPRTTVCLTLQVIPVGSAPDAEGVRK
jgi:stage V sporulation protein S